MTDQTPTRKRQAGPPALPEPRRPLPRPDRGPADAPDAPAPSSQAPAAPAAPAVTAGDDAVRRTLVRPSLGTARSREPATSSRREPPPEATGAESGLLARWSAANAVVSVTLVTGDVLCGRLEWVDALSFKLRRADAAPVIVMRSAVVTCVAQGPARG